MAVEEEVISSTTLTPYVYWSQDREFVYLKIDIQSANPFEIDLTSKGVVLQARSELKNYCLKLQWFKDVSLEDSSYQWSFQFVQFLLRKKETGLEWAHLLTNQEEYKNWIKTDWTRWDEMEEETSESEEDNYDENDELDPSFLKDINDLESLEHLESVSMEKNDNILNDALKDIQMEEVVEI